MIVLNLNTNYVPLSLNQYNAKYSIGDKYGLDITNYHYIFSITNDLTNNEIVFQPNLDNDYSNGGDFYWGTSHAQRMNEFKWIISTTQSNLCNGLLCFTGSNYDDSQWTYKVYVNSGTSSISGTPSISATASLLETGRLYFRI